MMVTVIISTRTPHMVARLGRAVGEVVQAVGALDSMWVVEAMGTVNSMWAVQAMGAVDSIRGDSGLLDWQGAGSGLKILWIRCMWPGLTLTCVAIFCAVILSCSSSCFILWSFSPICVLRQAICVCSWDTDLWGGGHSASW